jgi:hypothetical protein
MASHHLSRCYPLSEDSIDENVTLTAPGNYALGYLDGGTFIGFYVGRSGSDVNACLRSWIGVDGAATRYGPCAGAAYATRRRRSLPLPTPARGPVATVADCGYTHFEFCYASSHREAFEGECRAYHGFGGSYGSLDNERHPVPPDGSPWTCPVHLQHCTPSQSA